MIVNDETIVPETKPVEDAIVTDEVDAIELAEVDTKADDVEEADNGEVVAESTEDEPEESSTSKDVPKERIDEVTKARREAERDRDYWKQLAQQQRVAPEPVEPGKTLADFDYDEGKFTEYLSAKAKAEAVAESKQEVDQEKGARLQADFLGRENDFASKVDDYHTAITSPTLQFSPAMAAATLHAEKGPELRYYLAKNPDVSAKLANMAPIDMAIELGRIEATKLGREKPVSITKAPKPVPKIAGADSKPTLSINDPKISDAQFRKLREKQIANR